MTARPMTDTLADALPADPTDHGPIAVPSDAVRAVLGELAQRRNVDTLPAGTLTVDHTQDGGA